MRFILALGLTLFAFTAAADLDPCVTTEKLDLSTAKELPASFEFRSAVNAFALRGQKSRLTSAECWKQTRGSGVQFQESGYAVVYLQPIATDSGLCRSSTVGFKYTRGQWESAETSYFAVALPDGDGCDFLSPAELVDVYSLIEDYELRSLLLAEPQIRALHQRSPHAVRPPPPLRSVELRQIDGRIYYILGYVVDSCRRDEVHVSGVGSGGYDYVGGWQVLC